jgi:large subunit ribosomal protein L18
LAKGPQYNLPFRRRREGRTNYGKRRGLVISGTPRLVVRPSNKHLIAQVVEAKPDGDRVLVSAHSSELKEFGWKAPCGNLPAAYLTGLLAGRRAKATGIAEAILDLGLHARGAGSRIFAAVKGASDGGLMIPHGKDSVPKPERIKGQHVAKYGKELLPNADAYKKAFANYLKHKVKPEELPEHFATVESKINSSATEVHK